MKNTIENLRNSWKNGTLDLTVSENPDLFRGAGIVVCAPGDEPKDQLDIHVVTQNAEEVSSLIYALRDAGAERIDFANKYPYYKAIADAANRAIQESGDTLGSIVMAMLDTAEAMLDELKPEEPSVLFVYGTLMRGEHAHGMLEGADYLGKARLWDYAMYDLGNYPGILERECETVYGEVYAITHEMLPALDAYEGEGTLYKRKIITVETENGLLNAYAYIYNRTLPPHATIMKEPWKKELWNKDERDLVWYATYGSNLSEERFACYIQGGKCKENGKTYPGCKDKTLWRESYIAEFPGGVYFAKHSPSWENQGVAFYAPEANGFAIMRMYLITRNQLKDVQKQEGAGWYNRCYTLGYKDGREIITLTSRDRLPGNMPCAGYMCLIRRALIEECGLTEDETDNYINSCIARLVK